MNQNFEGCIIILCIIACNQNMLQSFYALNHCLHIKYVAQYVVSGVFVFVFFQTAEAIMKLNSSCSALQMSCDPLLKEIVSGPPLCDGITS